MVAYLASSFAAMGDQMGAMALVDELIGRSKANEKGVNIYLVYAFNSLGDIVNASYWLKKAKETNDVDLIWWAVDPLLRGLREKLSALRSAATPDFEGAEKHILKRLEQEMPKLEYHNLGHILDVLQAALVIARTEAVPEEETRMIRVAALLHDIGFIHSPKNHEEKGAEITREILPAFDFSGPQIDAICSMILATRLPQSPSTPLERILCDADLDYLGRDDFFEIGGKLFRELKAQGVVETEREWNLVQKTFLESHRYHTKFGKANREEQKRMRLQEIISKLSQR
jgi:predicted metal-dependent HD superfamily phosphohydrolase